MRRVVEQEIKETQDVTLGELADELLPPRDVVEMLRVVFTQDQFAELVDYIRFRMVYP